MTYCEITLIGNVGRDPALKFTPSGMAVCDFSLATSRRWTDRATNEKREETTWWRVTVWGSQAESVNQFVQKGKLVLVVADRIKADVYTGQDGQARTNLEVTAREVRFLGGRGDGSSGGRDDDYGGAPAEVDDIPF